MVACRTLALIIHKINDLGMWRELKGVTMMLSGAEHVSLFNYRLPRCHTGALLPLKDDLF
jgi:hypothetical protein